MRSSSWRKSLSIVDRLLKDSKSFSFIQAMRMLERASYFLSNVPGKNEAKESNIPLKMPVGRFNPPSKEVANTKSTQSLAFPSTEISSIKKAPFFKNHKQNTSADNHFIIKQNFIGLTGAVGVLPYHYTELINERNKQRDRAISSFIDIFNHRTTSLFYSASNKYSLPREYERAKLFSKTDQTESQHTQAILSLIGLGTAKLRNRHTLKDETLLFFSGIYNAQTRNPSNLEQIIGYYFDVPAKVEGFIGQWEPLIDDVRTKLPDRSNPKGQNVCLGRSTMLGKKGWYAQGKSRINLGPLNQKQFETFHPGSTAVKSINELARLYFEPEEKFELNLVVSKSKIANRVQLKKASPPALAWNAWLATQNDQQNNHKEHLTISVSTKA